MHETIKKELHPSLYPILLPSSDILKVCMVRKKGLARYCLVSTNYDASLTLEEQIKIIRKEVFRITKACWAIREIGLYIVLISDSKIRNLSDSDLQTDSSGFHAVIVQGIHIIGPGNKHIYKHSKWLNHTFGGASQISDTLRTLSA